MKRKLDAADWAAERQIEARGIRDARVLDAIATRTIRFKTPLMCECLELKGTESVLEVGAGCGYHAAVAECNLAKTGLGTNIVVACADGSRGWPEGAPEVSGHPGDPGRFVPLRGIEGWG